MKSHHKGWADRLPEALLAYRTTWWNTTGFSPYELVYGKSVVFPIEFQIKTLRTVTEENLDLTEAYKNRPNQLNEVDEKRIATVHHTTLIQQQHTKWNNIFIKKKIGLYCMIHSLKWIL